MACKGGGNSARQFRDPYFHLGQAYQATGKYREAAEVLTKSIALNPSLSHNDYPGDFGPLPAGPGAVKAGGRMKQRKKSCEVAAELKSNSTKSVTEEKRRRIISAAANLREPNGKISEIVAPEGVIAGVKWSRAQDCRRPEGAEAFSFQSDS